MAKEWAQQLYNSAAWRQLRKVIISKRGLHCEKCGRLVANPSQLVADHIIELTPENVGNVNVALNEDNIQLLCVDCHNAKHKRFGFNNQHNIFIVYGSPCSGKSTLVRESMKRGDIVFDLDKMFAAVSGCSLHDKPNEVNPVVWRLRDTFLEIVKLRYGKWHDAYIVGTYPYKAARENLAKTLNAKLVYCPATLEICLERAKERGTLAKETARWVQDWWANYEP